MTTVAKTGMQTGLAVVPMAEDGPEDVGGPRLQSLEAMGGGEGTKTADWGGEWRRCEVLEYDPYNREYLLRWLGGGGTGGSELRIDEAPLGGHTDEFARRDRLSVVSRGLR